MKTLLSFAASAVLVLSSEAVCSGQHYVQTNLDGSVPGSAEAMDPQLVNGWGFGPQCREYLVGVGRSYGSRYDNWGRVLVWDPPKRLVLAWQLTSQWKFDKEFVTEVEVNFIPVDKTRTRVALEHRNLERFGMDEETVRKSIESPDGWPGIMKRFAATASAQALQQAV